MEEVAINLISQYGLIGVFISTLLAYSVIPFPSEPAIITATFFFNPVYVVIAALIGSTIGSITGYYIGRKGIRKIIQKHHKKKKKWEIKAKKIFDKYGPISILVFGDFPLIGDPLIILAGTLRMKFWKFLTYSTIGKTIYFIIIVSIGKGFENLFF